MTRVRTRVILTLGAVVLTAALALSGYVLPSAPVPGGSTQPPVIGRSLSLCTVSADVAGQKLELSAVVGPDVTGSLTGTELGAATPAVTLSSANTATTFAPTRPVLLQTDGTVGSASAGAVISTVAAGPDEGVSLLPCVAPTTELWFTGLAASADQTSELVLTNPDRHQAEVDLHFFGPDGPVSAPGSLGVVVPGADTTSISLAGLLPNAVNGQVAVQAKVSVGRVSMLSHSTYRKDSQPAGGTWGVGGEAATSRVIPDVPAGDGSRQLVLANPGQRRSHVTVEVLGANGVFQPADNPTVDVDAQSTALVDLAGSLKGEAVTLRLTGTEPITASVTSTLTRKGAAADVATQSAAEPIRGVAIAPYAARKDLTGQLVLSNTGTDPAAATVTATDFDGGGLLTKDVSVDPGSTATVDLPAGKGGHLTVRTSATQLFAGITLSQPDGPVAGLTTAAVTSSLVNSAASRSTMDPSVGQ